MKTHLSVAAAILVCAAWSAGCSSASRSARPVYDPRQAGTVMDIEKAEVVAVREVENKASSSTSSVGPVTGGAVTSVLTGSVVPIGRAIGSAVGKAVGTEADAIIGEEITLVLEGGRTVIVVQERSTPPLAAGEKVLIVSPSGLSIYGRRSGLGAPIGGATRVLREDRFAPPDRTEDGPRARRGSLAAILAASQ